MDSRKIVQAVAAIAQNGYIKGFSEGKIFTGKSKGLCVPGLNCYSCPGAFGSCPIGALQAVFIDMKLKVPAYIIGFLLLMGVTLGRFVCGFLCPFGLLQELVHKIPLRKFRETRVMRELYKLKYAILLVFVIGIPLLLNLSGQIGFPAFCKWLCPAGTLEAGVPLALLNGRIAGAIGALFVWKLAVLALFIFLSAKILRPFCRFICPLGAIYSLFNRVSILHIKTDTAACDNCGGCASVCPMHVETPDSPECIRCGKCVRNCGAHAKAWSFNRACTNTQVKAGGGE